MKDKPPLAKTFSFHDIKARETRVLKKSSKATFYLSYEWHATDPHLINLQSIFNGEGNHFSNEKLQKKKLVYKYPIKSDKCLYINIS